MVFKIFGTLPNSEQERELRARTLRYLLYLTPAGVLIAMIGLTISQPELMADAFITAALIFFECLLMLLLLKKGQPTLASIIFVGFAFVLIAVRALEAGGVHSPGIPMLYVCALAAGLLLGQSAGIVTAIASSAVSLGLVVVEYAGYLPPPTLRYNALSIWWLYFFYMCIVVMLMRTSTQALLDAFKARETEIGNRQEAEQKLQLAVEAGGIGIWEWSPASGTLVWDDRMYQMYGRKPGSPVSYASWSASVIPADLTALEYDMTKPVEGGRIVQREFRIHTPKGIRHIFASEKVFHQQGQHDGKRLGINIDITERRLAEIEAADIKRRLERLIQEAPIGILVHRKFKPLLVNEKLADMLGFALPAQLLAVPDIRGLMDESGRIRVTDTYDGILAGGEAQDSEPFRYRRQDGAWIDGESRRFAINWDGEPAVCAMIIDVTARRVLESRLRQAQRLEAVGRLTGGIAHDFNNLLTVILGNARSLESMVAGNPAAQELVQLTHAAATRGADLTSRLLSFSRQQKLDIRAASVEKLVSDTCQLVQRTIGEQVQIAVRHGAALWAIDTDPSQFQNALLNLCINARDAMPKGGVLTIETRNVPKGDPKIMEAGFLEEPGSGLAQKDFVLISVRDSGTGMDEQTLQRAFEPFFTTKDVGAGSGLGLSMVYGFVKQTHGAIRILSSIGRGTVIEMLLPRAAREPVSVTPELPAAQPLVGGHQKILLVEDDELVRDYSTIQLRRLGYDVLSAGNGPAALDLLRSQGDIALLFTDVQLPFGMNGYQLAGKAREIAPQLPVLFSSGHPGQDGEELAGIDHRLFMLKKPHQPHELAAAIHKLLSAP